MEPSLHEMLGALDRITTISRELRALSTSGLLSYFSSSRNELEHLIVALELQVNILRKLQENYRG